MVGALKKWRDQKWVRLSTSGKILGPCGQKKADGDPERCLPLSKARSLTKSQRAATARAKKAGTRRGKQFVSNTKAAKVRTKK